MTLGRIAKALGVSPDAIKNFSEEAVFNSFNTFNDNSALHAAIGYNHQCTFNPLDKYLEVVEENKKLYEALLKEKDEKIALLQKLAEKK